ncbi:glycerol-3-phosphate 1-O-acyltransferase PlsB [Acinetobacter equi]|uniref:Glycerol-3-phosphate acyltransferase n=1 Tax=Acinetobacter equi TaxID=1324350 RepID=A0A0N7GXY5_9GAMM|nr:glycerol-3-phosphate 1-O-acyltransferase PlsB [Acinetobacter equi]ALH96011.1 glycerol-3-phosphate acyltransferase [Acinetobacter equi]
MSKSYSKIYRNLTKTILDKIVSPQVLGNTAELEQNISHEKNTKVCYVLEDASLSNTVLIDKEAIQRGLPSVFSKIEFDSLHEDDSMLVLNENNASQEDYHYSAKLLRLIETLEKNPQYDIQLVPVTVLWGRSPQYENSWVKALFADAWSKPNKIKQTLNISLYGRENYIEFHKPLSLRELFNQAKVEYPNFSPAHFVVQKLDQNFHNYKEAVLGPDLSDRRNLINQLMKTEVVQNAIRKESIDQKISMFEAESRAKNYFLEIVSDFSYSTLRFAELALAKLWTQLYDGIEVHNFDTVRELAKDYQIVYTPCHRSHIDYLLLSYVIFNRGLMVPHIAAGINLNLPVVGQILRGGGAYFIRRSFNGNELYTSVFKSYLNSLIQRNTPLEYFIEGGRSRTGLLLPPKKGMLAMTIESHLQANNKPIAFIPTYFGYEKLMEGTSYLNELNGKPKEAESLWGVLNSVRKIEKVFGQVHVNFGDPIFLDDVLDQYKAQNITTTQNQALPEAVLSSVNTIAHDILKNINKAVVINPISLISLILLNSSDFKLEQTDLITQIDAFRALLIDLKYDERMIISPLSSLEIIEYAQKLKQVENITENSIHYIRVSESQKILLSYFSNNILHCFILASTIASIIQSVQQISKQNLLHIIEKVYPFIKEEFFLKWHDHELTEQLDLILNEFKSKSWISMDDIQIKSNQNQVTFELLASLSSLSMNNFILIQKLIDLYSEKIELDTKTLEKMSKATLKRLAGHQALNTGYYFDSATIKSCTTTLQAIGMIKITQNIITKSNNFNQIFNVSFNWYNTIIQNLIDNSTFFTDRELLQLKHTENKKI